MPEPILAPTEPTDDTVTPPSEPVVKNPEAVLAKNAELLGKLATEKKEREALAVRVSEFEKAEADRQQKALEKKGDYDKLRENMEASHKSALEAEQGRYRSLFENSARYQLAVEIGKHAPIQGTEERLAKLLLLDEIKPTEENGKVVWRKIATDEEVALNEFIPSISTAYGEYFQANNNPGGDAPGNTGKTTSTGKAWEKATLTERNAAIRAAGGDVEKAKKNFK